MIDVKHLPTPRSVVAAALLMGFALSFCSGCAVPQPRGNGKLERLVEPTTKRGYWLYLPETYVQPETTVERPTRWPIVVSFHGMKPFDNAYPQAREWQQEADRYGFIVIAPELRYADVFAQFPVRQITRNFAKDEEASLAILSHVIAEHNGDPSNVLSTSWSSGGYMAHYMINRHPERFSALAVRQSNFSPTVLNPDATRRSRYHPILILNTQNDFAICKRESKEAVQWYETHNYKNVFWVYIKDKGHERTPDLAADFFGRVAGVEPRKRPTVLVNRQAIDGNQEGMRFLAGEMGELEAEPGQRWTSVSAPLPDEAEPANATRAEPIRTPQASRNRTTPPRRQAPAIPSAERSNMVQIRVTAAIGIEPLHLGFAAECPASWRESADFLWTLNGKPIGRGINGQQTLASAGEHELGLLVVTRNSQEHRATMKIRVLPRLDASVGPAQTANRHAGF